MARKEKSHYVDAGFSVQVQRLVRVGQTEAMFLHTSAGDGDLGGRKFRVSSVIPSGDILVEFDRQPDEAKSTLGYDRYIVRMRDIVDAIVKSISERA